MHVAVALVLTGQALACGPYGVDPADLSVAELRSYGPAGLEWLLHTHAASIEAYKAHLDDPSNPVPDGWSDIAAALDAVGGQYDNFASGLYWYTDMDQARAAARELGKPIISLRLLGRLDEQRSCANSRFFRTALYADDAIAPMLRDKFILHWQSIRPVPTITIDFGDGRRIERTVTGNSLHLALDSKGRPMDALPGLNAPMVFETWLHDIHEWHDHLVATDPQAGFGYRQQWHRFRLVDVTDAWASNLTDQGNPPDRDVLPAVLAQGLTVSKARIEVPFLRAMEAAAWIENDMTQQRWNAVAKHYVDDARLSPGSRRLMAKQCRPAPDMIEQFERSIALDTARNRYLLHRRVHEWFATGDVPQEITADQLTSRVYDELFLTPDDDPWLGLAPADAYAALDDNGLVR